MTEWKDISTAPKDGTVVDLWAKNLLTWDKREERLVNRRWATVKHWAGREYENWNGVGENYEVTHWMPLPPPPKTSTDGG